MNDIMKTDRKQFTSTHWGTYLVESSAGFINSLHPINDDPSPSPIGESILPANEHRCRIRPSTDTAVMLGIAHTLISEELHDKASLDR